MKKLLHLFLFFIAVQVQAQENEVVMFEEPPTSNEILESFGEPVVKMRGEKKSRKIVFNEPVTETPTVSENLVSETSKTEQKPVVVASKNNTEHHKETKNQKNHKIPVAFPMTFMPGSSELSKEAQRYIDSMAEALKKKSDLSIHISGHTDIVGGDAVNKPLSLKRAESVRNYLKIVHQIDISRVEISGEGASMPLDLKNPTSMVNRRVQFEKIIK